MSQRSSTPAGPGGASGPGQPEPDDWEDDDDEWPDDLWPDDDETPEGAAAGAGAASRPWGDGPAWPAPWPAMPPPPPPGRRVPPAALIAIALVAAGIGAVIVLAVGGLSGSPATPASQPTAQGPPQPGAGGGGAFPSGSGTSEMFVGGRVTAVSATSISIGGPGRTITAAVTSSTRFTGQVSSISGVKVGDQVTAQLTQNGGSITVVSISDPAQIPSGGGAP